MTNEVKKTESWMITIILVVLTITLCFICFHYYLEWKYRSVWLLQPCELCATTNPNQASCIHECFIKREFVNNSMISYHINTSELGKYLVPVGENGN